jgi:hydroxymethylbilane synthase
VIASRKSLLAQAQAQSVGLWLKEVNPRLVVEYRWIETEGDQKPDVSLTSAGGKGLFAKAVEDTVLSHDADLAVHSLKDLPTQLTSGLILAAIPSRGDVRDCLVSQAGSASIKDLPKGVTLGTASPRRAAQVLRIRPDIQIQLIRGNVETRLRKVLIDKTYGATILAVAGLQRANLSQHALHPIPTETMLPSAAQGALALQCRADDHVTLTRCLPLNHAPTAAAVQAERMVVAALDGNCHASIACHCHPVDAAFALEARVFSHDGVTCIEGSFTSSQKLLSKAVRTLAADLIARGAKALVSTASTED